MSNTPQTPKRVNDLVRIADLEPGEAFRFQPDHPLCGYRYMLHSHESPTRSVIGTFASPGAGSYNNDIVVRRAQPDLTAHRLE